MRAKISDFGLVKKAPQGMKSLDTRVAGTFGYLAPEYAETGKVTKTVDVYSLGAILMEMITGKKAIDDTKEIEEEGWMEIHLVTWFRRVLQNRDIDKEIDQVLNPDEESLRSIYKVAELAGKCTEAKPRQRPDITYVVNILVPLVEQWKAPSSQEEETVIHVPICGNQQQKHATI
ncbi:Leucine-rich repeat protein kinase family protein [Euphorbia peplus]|nr:Leucine-rich repeat protein kinase family protein [Euphorbia peplus]